FVLLLFPFSALSQALYCSSLTCSIQSAALPSSCSWMAIWVIAVVGVAPCQCFSEGGIQTTSPGRISSTGPPQRCTLPQPAVTIRVWPSGWVCHAVRAPGSKVTLAPRTRAGAGGLNSGSTRTVPVKYSAGPLPEGCEPLLLISISELFLFRGAANTPAMKLPASAPPTNHRLFMDPLRSLLRSPGGSSCRSATGHLLELLGVPGSLHRDPGGGIIDVTQIVGREFDGDCPDVFVQTLQL